MNDDDGAEVRASTIRSTAPLRLSRIVVYALPAMPLAALSLPIFAYLPQWYAEHSGISLSVVGAIFAGSKIWDVAIDPFAGALCDRFESRYGRRRQWLVAGTPIILIATFFLFVYPHVAGAGVQITPWYVAGWLIVLYTGWSLLSISHLSWGAELSSDYDHRSRILGTRELLFFLGTLTALLIPASIERLGHDRSVQIAGMGVAVLIFLPLTVALSTTLVGETRNRPSPPIAWRVALQALLQNGPLRRLLAADFALLVGYTLNGSMFLWLARDVLLLGRWSAALLFVFVIGGIVFIPLVIKLAYRFGKHRLLALTSALNAAVLPLLLLVPTGDLVLSGLTFLLLSLNVAAGPVLSRAIAADVVDYDEVRSGRARTGFIFSLVTMTNQIGSATGVWLAFQLLDLIGFSPGASEHDPETLLYFRWIYVGVPALLSLAVAALMLHFPIDRASQRDLRQRIETRALNAPDAPRID